jgi:transposase
LRFRLTIKAAAVTASILILNRFKHFRRIATRYEKRAVNYRTMWLIAAIVLAL